MMQIEANHLLIVSFLLLKQYRDQLEIPLNGQTPEFQLRTQSPSLNVVCRSKLHGLVVCGGGDGAVECFDMRTKSSIGRINVVEHGGDINEEVTALKIDEDGGFAMAAESSGGKVAAEKPNPTIFLKACELCMYGMIVGMIYGVQEMQDAMLGLGEVMSTPSRRCRSHGGSVCTFERVFLT